MTLGLHWVGHVAVELLTAFLQHFLLPVLFASWEYWLGKTKKLAANSTIELIAWGFRRLYRRRKVMIQKTFPLGPLTIGLALSDAGQAKASVGLSLSGSVGGGQAAGVVKGSLSLGGEVDVSARQAADLGIGALELVVASSPLAVAALEALKMEVDKVLAPAASS